MSNIWVPLKYSNILRKKKSPTSQISKYSSIHISKNILSHLNMRKIWWGGLAHAWVPFVPSHWHHLLHCQNIPLQMPKYPITNAKISQYKCENILFQMWKYFRYKYENSWFENIALSIKISIWHSCAGKDVFSSGIVFLSQTFTFLIFRLEIRVKVLRKICHTN